jgi:hypothetical protein
LAAIAPVAPIEFFILRNDEKYLDLFNTSLRAKVTLPTGNKLPSNADVALVNYYLHSLFSQVDLSQNDTLITLAENTYPYISYLEATLNYGDEANRGHMTAALFYKGNQSTIDDMQGDANTGLNYVEI